MSRHAKELELLGVPTAPCIGENIVEYVKGWDQLHNSGIPHRYTVFPLPVAGVSRLVHEVYVNGNDPVTGRPIMQEVIEALTKPLTEEEQQTGQPETVTEPRLLPPDTEENLQELFKKNDWTDYLPVTMPTEARVEAMLKGTSHQPDEVVKTMTWPGGGRQLTVEKAAVCAVMAGARPAFFPAILALGTAAPFGNSTTSMANMMVVNGPIRQEIGMNCGIAAMGPYNEANAVLGRSFTIISKTAGNLHAGLTNFSTLGSNLQYNSICIAENEEALPEGWLPLHVQHGYKKEDSVLTTGIGWSYISSVGEAEAEYAPQRLISAYMKALSGVGSSATICADPLVAGILHDQEGFTSKEAFAQWLAENTEIPTHQYWGNGLTTSFYSNLGLQGVEPYATWKKQPADAPVKPFTNPRAINTVIVGGMSNTMWFVTDFRLGKGILIDDWR